MKKKINKEHKKSYDPQNNADSMWNRSHYQRVMRGGKDIQKMLDIEDEGPEPFPKVDPLKLVDILHSMYEEEEEEESED
jgi:hypothetical protein